MPDSFWFGFFGAMGVISCLSAFALLGLILGFIQGFIGAMCEDIKNDPKF